MTGRDKGTTWRTFGTLCRELDWSRGRLLHELRSGLPYRTFPPGHVIDWHDPEVERTLDVANSSVQPVLGVFGGGGIGFDSPIITIEVLLPADDASPAPSPPALEPPSADVPVTATDSVTWARATTLRLRDENRIPEEAKKGKIGPPP